MFRRIPLAVLIFLFTTVSMGWGGQVPSGDRISINTLVIPSRNHTRMQPEIFYAFRTTAKKYAPELKMNFVLFNPFHSKFVGKRSVTQEYMLKLFEKSALDVLKIKKQHPNSEYLLGNIKAYIKSNPDASVAKAYRATERYMRDYQFLIVESSDTYGAHPIFYKKGVLNVELAEGANIKDLIETIYGLFFVDVALAQGKPIWGTCHGSQIGYLHAGGKLGRLFEYDPQGYDNVEFKKSGKKYIKEEIWRIDKMLYTQKKGSDYKDYGTTVYEVPEIYKRKGQKGREFYLNKDFQHSLALVEPIPKTITVISYHPLSEYKKSFIARRRKVPAAQWKFLPCVD